MTASVNLRNLIRHYRPAVTGFLRWWLAELHGLLPPGLRRAQDRLILTLRDGRIHAALESGKPLGIFPLAGPGIGDLVRDDTPTVLRLPPEEALQRELRLPAVAEENLREVLAFEMDRITPFKAGQVYYDGEVLERIPGARQIRVRLTIVPRPFLDGILEGLEVVGVRPAIVEAGAPPPAADPPWAAPMNLLPPERRPRSGARPTPMNATLAALALILFGAAVLLPLSGQRAQAEAMQQVADVARREALAADNLRAEVERLELAARFLIGLKRDMPIAVEVLDELARLLPDDTWITNLTLNGGALIIQGESPTASGLIEIVETSPLFSGAQFRSPVTKNPASGLERFQIGARVSGGPRP